MMGSVVGKFATHDLREKAVAQLRGRNCGGLEPMDEDVASLIYELEVHQLELEMQNEELRRTQQDLVESRNQYLDLFELAPVGYLTLDPGGVIREANLALSKLCGIERGNIVGKRVEMFVADDDRDVCYLHLQAVAQTKGRQGCELRLLRPDGSTVWVRVETVTSGKDDNGAEYGYRMTLTDVSNQKEAQDNLRRSEDSLRESQTRLEKSNGELKQKAQQLEDLALQLCGVEAREREKLAEILHDDLQQLLVSVKLRLGMLVKKVKGDQETVEEIQEVKTVLTQSIEKTRRLSRELSPTVLRGEGLFATLQAICKEMEERHHLKVELTGDPTINPSSEAAANCVCRAVRELLFNVVKHSGVETARVQMSKTVRDELCVEVSDRGVGFVPPHPSLSSSGSGFGLPCIHDRLGLVGGRLIVCSPPGQGTTVRVVVPAGSFGDQPFHSGSTETRPEDTWRLRGGAAAGSTGE